VIIALSKMKYSYQISKVVNTCLILLEVHGFHVDKSLYLAMFKKSSLEESNGPTTERT